MKQIFIRFKANKKGFICLFRIEVNQRILQAKHIKAEANFPFYLFYLFRFKANILKRNEVNIFKKNRILFEA
jgi:hypothetical protein